MVNGEKISSSGVGRLFSNLPAGARVSVGVERDSGVQRLDYTVGAIEHRPWIFKPVSGSTPDQIRLRDGWLNG
jgi:hypothetical protein